MGKVTGHGLANYLRSTEVAAKAKAKGKEESPAWTILQDFGRSPITPNTSLGMSFSRRPDAGEEDMPSLSVTKYGTDKDGNEKAWGTRTYAPITPAVVAFLNQFGAVLEDAFGLHNAKNAMKELGEQVLAAAKQASK